MSQDPMRYALQLEMLEQEGVDTDEQAIELLRSEFALTQNAGYFDVLSAREIELGAVRRTWLQEGVARYDVELLVPERDDIRDDERAVARLREALTNAINASYFLRVCDEPLKLRLLARAPVAAPVPLRAAA